MLKLDERDSLRMWAFENNFCDPELLIEGRGDKLFFKISRTAKQYRRLEKMCKDRRT